MGFSGGRSNVKAYVAHLRTSTAEGATPVKRSERAQALSPRSLRWLLTRGRKDLEEVLPEDAIIFSVTYDMLLG